MAAFWKAWRSGSPLSILLISALPPIDEAAYVLLSVFFPPAVRMLTECRLLYQLCPLQSPPWRNKLIKSYLWCSFFSLTEAIAVVKAVIISIFLSCNIEASGNYLVSHNRAHMRDSTVYYSCCAHCV